MIWLDWPTGATYEISPVVAVVFGILATFLAEFCALLRQRVLTRVDCCKGY